MPPTFGKVASIAAAGILATASITAHADVIPVTSGLEEAELANLETGDQLVLSDYNGTIPFAGQSVTLRGFSGVLGYATESAYVVTVEGSAASGDEMAPRGRMLLIAPYNQAVASERFDARRLHSALSEAPRAGGFKAVLASLDDLAGDQDTGIFLGRLGRTDFNVATMGSAEQELDRRTRVGARSIREVRFMAPESVSGSERFIVERFAKALAEGNTDEVAQLMDPLPYGGAPDARTVAAASLLSWADWEGFSTASPEKVGDTSWLVTGGGTRAQIELRRTSEFAFISSISLGE